MNEYFLLKRFQSKVKFYVDNKLAFADNTLISPEEFDYTDIGMWHGYSHNGMMFVYLSNKSNKNDETLFIENCREIASETMSDKYVGVTKCLKGILIRALSTSGDSIYNFFNKVSGLI